MTERIEIESDITAKLFGSFDGNINTVRNGFGVDISLRDTSIIINGVEQNVLLAGALIRKLINIVERGNDLDPAQVKQAMDMLERGEDSDIIPLNTDTVATTVRGKKIKCKTAGQKRYVDAINKNTITLCVGPAGTGKTYLAVSLAVSAYKAGMVERIVLSRPAIEAGEKLGFLPGDLQEKVNPYLQPLYDALGDLLGAENYPKLIERGIIIVAPLAYMRGRTLGGAFIILDEAQNTTEEQMKMFLTRLGEGSKMVVTGDITQIDLPAGKNSGLKQAVRILNDIKGIEIIKLSEKDVVRHELVASIIKAYESGDTAYKNKD